MTMGGLVIVWWVMKSGGGLSFLLSRVGLKERFCVLFSPSHIMSLSDQHPYSLFVTSGLQSPTLAWAHVEVGDNTNTYLASADVVAS